VNEDFKALDNELSRGALPSAAQAPVAAQPTQGRDTDSVFNSAATQMPALRELVDASAHSSGRAKEAAPIASVTTPPSHEERLSPPDEAGGKVLSLKEQEAAYFRDLLDRYDGNKSKVADAAGLTLRTLYRRLKDAGIE
jgi:DNA-binding NtrC family response regulator